jgi:hypothetical protein
VGLTAKLVAEILVRVALVGLPPALPIVILRVLLVVMLIAPVIVPEDVTLSVHPDVGEMCVNQPAHLFVIRHVLIAVKQTVPVVVIPNAVLVVGLVVLEIIEQVTHRLLMRFKTQSLWNIPERLFIYTNI